MSDPEHRSEFAQFPERLLAVVVTVSIVGIVLLAVSALWSRELLDAAEAQYAQVEELYGEILLLDEILTMSTKQAVAERLLALSRPAGAGASDGVARRRADAWEARYRDAETRLDAALGRLDALLELSPARRQLAQMTADANDALVAIEHRALEAERDAELHAANEALAGSEYARWKDAYTKGMSAMIADMREHFGRQIELQRTIFGAVLPVAVCLVALMGVLWWSTRRSLTRWGTALAAATAQLAATRDGARAARDEAQHARDEAERARLAMEDAVDAARLGVFELRTDGSMSVSGHAMVGVDPPSHRLDAMVSTIAPEERSAVELELRRALSTDSPRVGSSEVRTVNGRVLAISWRRIEDTDGVRLLGLLQDVTEQRREAARLEDEVEAKSALAEARRLDNAALLRLMLRAEQDGQERLAQLVHDELQQLIVSGLQFARMGRDAAARGDDPSDPLAACIEAVGRAHEAARGVHSALRAPSFDAMSLPEALHAVAERAPIAVDVHIEGGRDAAYERVGPAERWVIGLVAQESVLNAMKYADVDRARIELVDDGAEVVLTVSDEGRGFDTTRVPDGTGLADARRRARWVGGRLEVESAPGAGTRVTLAVPGPDVRRQMTSAPMGAMPSAAALRVLLVDDERLVRHATASLLWQSGRFDVVAHARTGAEAVSAAVALAPDAVVMDFGLPDCSGAEATRQLLAEHPSARVVGYTAHPDAARAAMRAAGAVAVVDKGADVRVLVEALEG